MNLWEAFNQLNNLYEGIDKKYGNESGTTIDLNKCRMIVSNVMDNRGEYESSACVDYYPVGSIEPVLTRVQVRVLVTRTTDTGKEFLCQRTRFGFKLPGGGYDVSKDHGSILNTAKREIYEELNIELTNVKNSGVTGWKYRVDPWVLANVPNEEDRWYGYYSYYITAEYDHDGNNNNPEEINKWKWYPIDLLYKVNNNLYKQVANTLTENWGDGSHGKQDYTIPGIISYCCESPAQVAAILKSGYIKASTAPETHETDKVDNGNTGRGKRLRPARYPYVSFSKQLYSHAYRRPNKWSFGIALDEPLLSQRYEFTDRDHTYNSLKFSHLYKSEDNKFMARTTLFGYIEVSEEIYNLILTAMQNKAGVQSVKFQDDTSLVKPKVSDMKRQDAWKITTDKISNNGYRSANRDLKNINFNKSTYIKGATLYDNQFSVTISDFAPEERQQILDYLLGNTYYNEGERRVWCKTIDGVHFNTDEIYGIIIPDILEETLVEIMIDLEDSNLGETLTLSSTQQDALEYICKYVEDNNLEFLVHEAADEFHLADLDKLRGIQTSDTR